MARTQIDASLVPSAAFAIANIENLIINGGMEVWQRGTSFSNPASNAYTVDRWRMRKSGGTLPTIDLAQDTANHENPGLYCLDVNVTATGATSPRFAMQTLFDDGNIGSVSQLNGLTVTFSMRVKTTMAGVQIMKRDGGGTSFGTTHTGGGAYETLSITFTVSQGVGQTVILAVGIGDPIAGTGNTIAGTGHIYMDNSMLVVGSLAASYHPTDPAVEILRCQRYYEKSYNLSDAPATNTSTNVEWFYGALFGATSSRFTGRFKTQKRAAPTMTFYRQDGTLNSWTFRTSADASTNRTVTLNDNNTRDFQVIQTTGTEIACFGHWTAESEVA